MSTRAHSSPKPSTAIPTMAMTGAGTGAATMKTMVHAGPNKIELRDWPRPVIKAPGDAVVRVTHTTICGTDLQFLKGDMATAKPCRIMGHEGVGVIDRVGASVTTFKSGDHGVMACDSAYSTCAVCSRRMYSHCTTVARCWQIRVTAVRPNTPVSRHEPVSHPEKMRR